MACGLLLSPSTSSCKKRRFRSFHSQRILQQTGKFFLFPFRPKTGLSFHEQRISQQQTRKAFSRPFRPETGLSFHDQRISQQTRKVLSFPFRPKTGFSSVAVASTKSCASSSGCPATVEFEEEAGCSSHGGELAPEVSPVDFVATSVVSAADLGARNRRLEKNLRRQSERATYLLAAVASSVGITFLAAGAVYYRFAWQTQGAEVPFSEMFGTFALAVGASVGMEYWARWAHKALWHDSLWSMHESHHLPRDGPFETNDIFAIINAVPAISLMAYGFFHKGLVPGLCFGAGLGITVFGIAYMFIHDGLVHRRFPTGPIANVPYFQKVAAAHQLHHADKFKGVPFGLFLGPQELECQPGGSEELEKMFQMRKKLQSSSK